MPEMRRVWRVTSRQRLRCGPFNVLACNTLGPCGIRYSVIGLNAPWGGGACKTDLIFADANDDRYRHPHDVGRASAGRGVCVGNETARGDVAGKGVVGVGCDVVGDQLEL